jgi:lipopolysaccharide transport system ATP-binding protein
VSDIAIAADALSKRYQLSHQRPGADRLTESLARILRSPFERLRGSAPDGTEWIWALRDVSFTARKGDVIGVIGRNGAGKSTLLKVLSRITEPTTGSAVLRGRAATLLEVGTGFHPELTGRENVYLSGAVLGMRRAEIARKFDDIVEFAGVGQFLDTPLKRYSSGMQVRLGFAVAAHLEPEILFVDEVLAVGDAEFQKRSLGRIEEMGATGRTVIFVSHSMPAMLRLCPRAILLDHGRVIAEGPTHEVVRAYLETDLGRTSERSWTIDTGPGDEVARLKSVRVVTDGSTADEVDIREAVNIEVEYWSGSPGDLRPFANLHFFNDEGVCLFITSDTNDRAWSIKPRNPGVVRSTVRIPGNFLAEGRIVVTAAVSTINPTVIHAIERDTVAFQVTDRSTGDGVRGEFANDLPGVVRPMLDWRVEILEAGLEVPLPD